MRRVFIYFFKKCLDIFFKILLPFDILSHYRNIDNSHWLREDVKRILEKVFREQHMD